MNLSGNSASIGTLCCKRTRNGATHSTETTARIIVTVVTNLIRTRIDLVLCQREWKRYGIFRLC